MSDMGNDPQVAAEIATEIKRIGTETQSQLKNLHESFQRDLKAARDLAAETRDYTDAQIKALSESAVAKYEALEKALKKQLQDTTASFEGALDEVKTALNRRTMHTGSPESEAKARADAIEFKRVRASLRGDLHASQEIAVSDEEVKEIAEYARAFRFSMLRKDEKRWNSEEAKALTTGEDPSGGWQVPPLMYNRIIKRIYDSSPMRQLATVIQIGTDRLEYPLDDGEAGAGFVGEEELRPETTTPTVAIGTILVNEIYAKPKITQRLLDDATTDIEGWLADKVAEKMARMEATAFITGSGTKRPRGILTLPPGTARGQVKTVVSGNATALTADALVTMPFQLQEAYLNNARWLMKRSTLATVALFKNGQGDYLWSDGLRGATGMSLVGYPISFADDMPAVAAGALPIAFGDWRESYLIVDRLGIVMLRDPYSSKPFVEFYSRRRVGGDVINSDAYAVMKISL